MLKSTYLLKTLVFHIENNNKYTYFYMCKKTATMPKSLFVLFELMFFTVSPKR